MRLVRAAAAFLMALLVPAVSAQLPTDPGIAVALDVTPATATVPLGASAMFDVKVTVTLSNMVCQSPEDIPVTLALAETGGPVSGIAHVLPANLAVNVAAGQYVGSTGMGHNNVTFAVSVATAAPANHDHSYAISATGPGALPASCHAASPNAPKASTAGPKTAAIKTGAAPASSNSTTAMSMTSSASSSKKSFFLPMPIEVGMLLAFGLAGRRRL